ncbi:MAG: nitrite/sulfite reductase [Azospirillaceae bacterium]
MYVQTEIDGALLAQRTAQFRDQVARRLSGELSEDEFKPLRLMNGLYLQLHAYMLRVAIPYGTLSADQMDVLADIAERYDRGYGHFTTRQNIQFNWPRLEDVPDILDDLAKVGLHAIQTSGNCIRNVTADPFAGAVADEIDDPRVWAEVIRQWSTLHPEFSFLPRKFKIAVTGAAHDRAATWFHDIGLIVRENAGGERGFEVLVGGGQGRTPMIARQVRDFLPEAHLLSYLEAILRVYNLAGRRDNKYKARIKILVHETGIEDFRRQVEAEWAAIRDGALTLDPSSVARIRQGFAGPDLPARATTAHDERLARDFVYARWARHNLVAHRHAEHAIVTVSLKPVGGVPGDATAEQMRSLADLARRFSRDEIRIHHTQNVILPHVARADLPALHDALDAAGLAAANVGLVGDIIACPGLDYCALANARSIPIAQAISRRLAEPEALEAIGPIKINISGCINACGHHHVGHIGILGVERKGEEQYQLTLGGRSDENPAIGRVLGPGFTAEGVVPAIEKILEAYLAHRHEGESFIDAVTRLGNDPFKEAVYGA